MEVWMQQLSCASTDHWREMLYSNAGSLMYAQSEVQFSLQCCNFNIIYNMDGTQMPGKQYCNDLFHEKRVHFPNKMS